jgi:3-deoxy-7-phosphoheptulonate synthase
VVAGLNAVDTREYTEQTFRALKEAGQVCARMGAYKPRTSPYSFQGYGKQCLPYVFELAGKYGVRVISMEVTRDEHLDEIREALRETGDPCGVMLQIGTRNTQNFELLKTVGSQRDFPILVKRGFGITLHESLLAAEYVASAGNRDIVFCLRGMKTNFGDPHRNLVDFAHVPVVKRLTRMPVCVDPSHSVGVRAEDQHGLQDIFHVAAQGIIAGRQPRAHRHPSRSAQGAGGRGTGAHPRRAAALPRGLRDLARSVRKKVRLRLKSCLAPFF